MAQSCREILDNNGTPQEAGPDFASACTRMLDRIHNHDWQQSLEDDDIFSESPAALVHWAPIADELKIRDEEIVLNSVRFRWIEVRREVKRLVSSPISLDDPRAQLKDRP